MEKRLMMFLVALFISVGIATAQTQVSGTVISSEDNEPIIGVYAAAIGTMLSSVFILAANSWMQNPVGTKFNPELGRAELDGVK